MAIVLFRSSPFKNNSSLLCGKKKVRERGGIAFKLLLLLLLLLLLGVLLGVLRLLIIKLSLILLIVDKVFNNNINITVIYIYIFLIILSIPTLTTGFQWKSCKYEEVRDGTCNYYQLVYY